MKENASDRLKNFLVNGIGTSARQDDALPDSVFEQETGEERIPEEGTYCWESTAETPQAAPAELSSLEADISEIREMLKELLAREAPSAPDMSAYLTTREQSKAMNATVAKLEASSSNKVLVAALEQICSMREDFFRLCKGMEERIDELDAATVLSSFQAYEVDMENILMDSGVFIGHFDFPRINTLHQRIVGVVPTGDKEKDGTIATRLSDGYKLADKVLLKEKVEVYKFDRNLAPEETPVEAESEEEVEETPSEPAAAPGNEVPSDTEETPATEQTEEPAAETLSETLEQTVAEEDVMEEKE